MKMILGSLAVLLGVVGTTACLAAIVFVFVYANDLNDASSETLQSVDQSLTFVDKRVKMADSAVTLFKNRVDDARSLVAKLLRDGRKNPGDHPKLEAVEKELTQYFETAMSTMETIADSAETLAKWVVLFDKLPFRGKSKSASDAAVLGDADQLAAQLRELSTLLHSLKSRIADFKKGVDSEELAKAVEDVASRLSDRLGNVQSRVTIIAQQLDAIETDVDEMQQKLPEWINTGKYVAAVVLFWMAIGQVCLLLRGVAMARGDRA